MVENLYLFLAMIERSTLLGQMPGAIHGFSTRHYGPVRTGSRPLSEIVMNRERLATDGGFRLGNGVMLNQVHGRHVLRVSGKDRGMGMTPGGDMPPDGDALITNDRGTVLIVRTADCVPLLLYDPTVHAIAAIHAGWKGTSLNIVGTTVAALQREYGVLPGSIRVAIGPAIRACHYDVSTTQDGRVELFERLFKADVVVRADGGVALDLVEANRQQCLAAGIQNEHINLHPDCTAERVDRWASFRGGDQALDHQIWSFVAMEVENGR